MPRGSCLDSCMCYFKGVSSLTKRFNRLWWACWMSRALYQIQHSDYSLQSLTSTSFWCQMLRPTTPRPPLSRDSFIMANGRARTSLYCKQAREPTFQFASTWCHLIESEQEAWNAYPWILPPAAANRGISIKWSAHCDLESQLITTLFFFSPVTTIIILHTYKVTVWPCDLVFERAAWERACGVIGFASAYVNVHHSEHLRGSHLLVSNYSSVQAALIKGAHCTGIVMV